MGFSDSIIDLWVRAGRCSSTLTGLAQYLDAYRTLLVGMFVIDVFHYAGPDGVNIDEARRLKQARAGLNRV